MGSIDTCSSLAYGEIAPSPGAQSGFGDEINDGIVLKEDISVDFDFTKEIDL